GRLLYVERTFLGQCLGDARPLAHARVVILDGRPTCEIDPGRRAPVQHCKQVGVSDAEAVEQIVTAGKITVEICETRGALVLRIGLARFGGLWIEQGHEQALVQLGSNEAKPLLQAGTTHAGGGREGRAGEAVRHVLQDRRILGHDLAVVGANRPNETERVDRVIVGSVASTLDLGIDLHEARCGVGFVECNACGHGAGERGEIEVHLHPSIDFCTRSHNIRRPSRILFEMVQKEPKRRGRPRAYDPDVALARAVESFWQAGYAATSLDDLSEATGMNRPSLYGAFGDKHDLYLSALAHYWQHSGGAMREALAYDRPLREALQRVYRLALSSYLSGRTGPRGCFAISTATTEAVRDAKIRTSLAQGLREIDEAFEA